MGFNQVHQEQTSRISQTSGDSMHNHANPGNKFLKNTIQFKNQNIQNQALRQTMQSKTSGRPQHLTSKSNGATSVRITAGAGIRKLNMKGPFNQPIRTTTDRKSVEGRGIIR